MAPIIIGAEVAFWVLLAGGLAVRYLLRMRRTSAVLLVSVPVIDVVVLTAAVIDMRNGADFHLTHGLAAIYLGYSVFFGHRTIRWVDQRVKHRFAGGPPPWKPPKYGVPRVKYEWMMSLRLIGAWVVAVAVLGLLVLVVGPGEQAGAITGFIGGSAKLPVIAVIWALAYTFWPPKPKNGKESHSPHAGHAGLEHPPAKRAPDTSPAATVE